MWPAAALPRCCAAAMRLPGHWKPTVQPCRRLTHPLLPAHPCAGPPPPGRPARRPAAALAGPRALRRRAADSGQPAPTHGSAGAAGASWLSRRPTCASRRCRCAARPWRVGAAAAPGRCHCRRGAGGGAARGGIPHLCGHRLQQDAGQAVQVGARGTALMPPRGVRVGCVLKSRLLDSCLVATLLPSACSGLHKPDDQTVLPPHEAAAFVAPLPVRALPGVGERCLPACQMPHAACIPGRSVQVVVPAQKRLHPPALLAPPLPPGAKTERDLQALGVHTAADLRSLPRHQLVARLGERTGAFLHAACRGNVRAAAGSSGRACAGCLLFAALGFWLWHSTAPALWHPLLQDATPVQPRGPPKTVTVEDSFKSCQGFGAAEKVGGHAGCQRAPRPCNCMHARRECVRLTLALTHCLQVVHVLAPDLLARLQEELEEGGRRAATLTAKWRRRGAGASERSSASCPMPPAVLGARVPEEEQASLADAAGDLLLLACACPGFHSMLCLTAPPPFSACPAGGGAGSSSHRAAAAQPDGAV